MDYIIETMQEQPDLCNRFQALVDILCLYIVNERALDKYRRLSRRYHPTEHITLEIVAHRSHQTYRQIFVYYSTKRWASKQSLFLFHGTFPSSFTLDLAFVRIPALELLPLYEHEILSLSNVIKMDTAEKLERLIKASDERRERAETERLFGLSEATTEAHADILHNVRLQRFNSIDIKE